MFYQYQNAISPLWYMLDSTNSPLQKEARVTSLICTYTQNKNWMLNADKSNSNGCKLWLSNFSFSLVHFCNVISAYTVILIRSFKCLSLVPFMVLRPYRYVADGSSISLGSRSIFKLNAKPYSLLEGSSNISYKLWNSQRS